MYKKITLEFSYSWHKPENEYQTVYGNIDGNGDMKPIEFTFRADYKNLTETFRVGKKYGEYGVKEVRISPLSTIIRITGLPDHQHYFKHIYLTRKDGTQIELYDIQEIKHLWWSDSCDVFACGDTQIIEPKEVESISFSVDGEMFYTIHLK